MADVVARLDDLGRPAWIAVMVLGFIFFWPVGLAVLGFLLWSGRMGCGRYGEMTRWQRHMADRWDRRMRAWGGGAGGADSGRSAGFSRSGNRAFDEYREETLRRLEEEEREFREFLERLRAAKDRSEFDQFMAERRSQPKAPPQSGEPPRQS